MMSLLKNSVFLGILTTVTSTMALADIGVVEANLAEAASSDRPAPAGNQLFANSEADFAWKAAVLGASQVLSPKQFVEVCAANKLSSDDQVLVVDSIDRQADGPVYNHLLVRLSAYGAGNIASPLVWATLGAAIGATFYLINSVNRSELDQTLDRGPTASRSAITGAAIGGGFGVASRYVATRAKREIEARKLTQHDCSAI